MIKALLFSGELFVYHKFNFALTFTTFIHEFLKRSKNWKLNSKIAKIIKNILKNRSNVKFLRKKAILLTFWLFSLSTCEGVNFSKAKIEPIIVCKKAVKRKFYIIHICKNRCSLCLEQSFQPRACLKLKILSIVKF